MVGESVNLSGNVGECRGTYIPIRFFHRIAYRLLIIDHPHAPSMFLLLDHRIAFIHIPKTAGEKIYGILTQAFGSGMVLQPDGSRKWRDFASTSFWGQDKPRGIDATHLHQDILYDYVGQELYESCLSFAVVRDPYDRFYSAFADIPSKIHYSRNVAKNTEPFWVHKYPEYGDPRQASATPAAVADMFRTFCTLVKRHHIVNDPITKHNIHLVPQSRFVYRKSTGDQSNTNTIKNVTHLIRFDRLHTDLVQMLCEHDATRFGGQLAASPYTGASSRCGRARPSARPSASRRRTTARRPRTSTPATPAGTGADAPTTRRAHHRHQQRRMRQKPKRAGGRPHRPPSRTCPSHYDRGLATLPHRFRQEFTAASCATKSKLAYFTEEAMQLVEQLYAEDFDRFGFVKRSALATASRTA